IINQKKEQIEKFGKDLYSQENNIEKIIAKAAEYCNVYTDNVLDLALRLEEDVAIMYQGRLAAICFCFPSGFIPSERVGMMLGDIHKPVADGEMLVKASPGIARVMT
ncbi:MAG: heme-dependent oxidative N-demethylase subunit alpha family protein, partial [bacterium]